ncbi:MAG: uracil-DNA glycosylase [Pseudomonadota bacterium]
MASDDIPQSWRAALEPVLSSPEARRLGGWLRAEEKAGKVIYPPRGERLTALALTPLEKVRVVILGQDPYHGSGQAHGLAFSVKDGVKPPPSLLNIFKELQDDMAVAPPGHGNLTRWAEQGVLMLNNTLTVQAGRAGSHAGRGWDAITDACVQAVVDRQEPCVFILWGSHARKKAGRVRGLNAPSGATHDHLVLTSAHPSPLSAHGGFFGSKPFSQTNAFLVAKGRAPIDWSLA